ncbi:bis(5'-nucleosyl)-tetraphosphatase (symmetrical) YqeK [Sporosarcina beigongshangi]|uniref:bis(5'-nucleosyl)-tetraphosphatase (symmetrical) YqeK n=1 Tax=Sporosarcina beigongshangi TaxID=2782538 RepID=UPI0019395304|nr:bis(5'-nucleosyl)-tetraphosphatase (symmetrical) YqeK [Sporosarcina beigongshangi]
MAVDHLKKELRQRLSNERYEHVLRVAETAKLLAKKYHISINQAEQAALFHDIAKCMDKADLHLALERGHEDARLFSFHHELWHAPVGAMIARDEFAVVDEDVLNAIRFHTTGRAGMSMLEKLIYVADMIEPGRSFPGVEVLRQHAEESLDTAMEACIYQTVQFLVSKKVPVFPDSIDCYNEHIKKSGSASNSSRRK